MNLSLPPSLPLGSFRNIVRVCPLFFFFFSVLRWGTINWLGNFLSNVHTVRKLFVEFSVLYWSAKNYIYGNISVLYVWSGNVENCIYRNFSVFRVGNNTDNIIIIIIIRI